jgi:transposase InsO family protein
LQTLEGYCAESRPSHLIYSETFVSQLKDDLLARELFINLKEAQVLLEDYRQHYNYHRPHGALGYITPAEAPAL